MMLQKCKLFGQSVMFDITYGLIKEKIVVGEGENKKLISYGVGIFLGIN